MSMPLREERLEEPPAETGPPRRRRRSEGPLDPRELARLRSAGTPLAYDPVQGCWLPLDCEDDISPPAPIRPAHCAGVRLRPWRAEDLAAYVALLDDPRVWAQLPEPYPDPLTADMAASLIEISRECAHHAVHAVEFEGAPVGQVRLEFDPDRPGEAEISYWLGAAFWGRGLGSKAVALGTRRGFDADLRLRTIFARVRRDNAASLRVLEKAGYRRVGPDPDAPDWETLRIRFEDAGPD